MKLLPELPKEITEYLQKVDGMITELGKIVMLLRQLSQIRAELQTTNFLLQRLVDITEGPKGTDKVA